MSGWNRPPLPRDQILLFGQTLGDRVPEDHTVRLFLDILDSLDWRPWERRYVLVAGQPPIPPRIMAGVIIYGLSHGIRSSRRLEWACESAVDFIWLAEGRTIDHSTFCRFRTTFKEELKDLFRQIGRLSMRVGLVALNQVAIDGTYVRANSSPNSTASAKTLEERIEELDKQIERMFAEADRADEYDTDLFGDKVPSTKLPAELANAKKRREELRKALEAAEKADAKRKGSSKGKESSKRSAKVPVADPDSAILPNKEGGFAPNYNPVATADGEIGMIVDADVLNHIGEAEVVLPAIERIEADLGKKPEQMLADGAFGTGDNLSGLASCGVEAVMPASQTQAADDNPANRPDPTTPVAEEDWPKLPRRAQTKKLDRAAFVYDSDRDSYRCPMGRELPFEGEETKNRETGGNSVYRIYRSTSCDGCPLAGECLSGKVTRRKVMHDQHEEARQEVAARMNTEAGKSAYKRRAHLGETPNAVIKEVMGLRRFLHRGLGKVQTEWLWACVTFNIRKLVKALGAMRAEVGIKAS